MEDKLNTIVSLLVAQNEANQKLNSHYLTKLAVIENLLSASLMPEPERSKAILDCKPLIEFSQKLLKDLIDS